MSSPTSVALNSHTKFGEAQAIATLLPEGGDDREYRSHRTILAWPLVMSWERGGPARTPLLVTCSQGEAWRLGRALPFHGMRLAS